FHESRPDYLPSGTMPNAVARTINSLKLKMSATGPARLLAAYGGITYLVYLETSGFSRMSPLLSALPMISLSVFTLLTSMQPHAKIFTTGAFISSALAIYLQSSAWAPVSFAALFVIGRNLLYFLSFQHLIREWSFPIALMTGLYLSFFTVVCFADLLFSIPTLVCCLFIGVASACFLVLASGSLAQGGSLDDTSNSQASIIRFVGAMMETACVSMFIYSAFARRTETTLFMYRICEYVAHGLLFLANEREF
ncbi:hypothetical protein PENTCL1PPCAC_5967, partial [Pristionchus entomophagus]